MAVEKESKMTKKVDAVGTKDDSAPEKVDFDPPVPFVFTDGKTGKTKCAAFLEIADTNDRKRQGLSKRAELDNLGGMLFEKCAGPFWMKDVEFPLDLLFVDRDGVVVEKTAMPVDKDGGTLYPTTKLATEHAIELPAGFCERNGIDVGDVVMPYEFRGE